MMSCGNVTSVRRMSLGCVICIGVLLLAISQDTSVLFAQTATGSMTGSVTDASGAAVVGARVELTNTSTNETRNVQSNGLGYYTFPLLPVGQYKLAVTAGGFKLFQQSPIQLDVGLALTINVKLQIGQQSQVVNVSADQEVVEAQSSSLGQVIDTHQIDDLPLNGRNSYSFATLVPGVIAPYGFTQTAFDEYNDHFISINGSRPNASLFLLDGGNNSEPGFNGPGVYPSVDLVEEYKVMTNNFSAEFTNTAGGVVNVVTKSGSNRLHGSAYEFFRNTGLSANNFFANEAGLPRSPFDFNQFGVSFGGPIKKDKTFFFFSYEGIRWSQGVTMVATLPTAAQRAGDFSQTDSAPGQVIPIFNPFTTAPDPSSPGNYIRQQFPGNKIPSNLIDPVARALLSYLPLPNSAGNAGTGANNFTSDTTQQIIKNDFSLRIDQVLSARQKLFGRFTISDTTQTRPDLYGNSPNFIDSDPTVGNDFLRQMQGTADYTAILGAKLVLELNTSYVYYLLSRHLNGYGLPTSSYDQSFFSSLGQMAFPTIYVSGMATNPSLANLGSNALFGEYNDLLNDPLATYHEYGNLTLLKGAHALKFGADFGHAEISGTDFKTPGSFDYFSTNYTQGPNPITDTNSGVGFASFLLGLGSGTLYTGGSYELVHNWYYGAYVQDDWKLTPKLTLNLGLRYDMNRPLVVQGGRMTNWDPSSPSPLQVPGLHLVGGAAFPGQNGLSDYAWNPNKGNLAPRLGFALALSPNTAVRGGFGLFTAPIDGAWFNGNGLPLSGWQGIQPWVTTLNGVTPLNNGLANQFPDGFILPSGSSLGLLTQVGQNLTAMNRDRPSSYAEQWNLDVQRTLPGSILFDLAYSGSHGLHLFGDYYNNQLPDADLALGNNLLTQVANPFYGHIASGPLSSPTVAMSQLLLPYPQFTTVILGNGSTFGASSYNALNLKVVKRFSRGFSFIGSYTWSKLMDNLPASETGFPGGAYADEIYGGGGGIQDYYNLKAERSVATFDTPQSLALNGIWELPFGRNKQLLNNNKALDYVVGGWQINVISLFQAGTPLEVFPVTNTLYNNGGVQRADWNGQNPTISVPTEKKLNQYFDVSDFSAPAAFTFGNSPRTLSVLRTPGVANFDISAIKNIPIREGMRVQFRAEAFNAFNRPQFGAPDTILGDGTTGVISTQVNLSREIQLAAKFEF